MNKEQAQNKVEKNAILITSEIIEKNILSIFAFSFLIVLLILLTYLFSRSFDEDIIPIKPFIQRFKEVNILNLMVYVLMNWFVLNGIICMVSRFSFDILNGVSKNVFYYFKYFFYKFDKYLLISFIILIISPYFSNLSLLMVFLLPIIFIYLAAIQLEDGILISFQKASSLLKKQYWKVFIQTLIGGAIVFVFLILLFPIALSGRVSYSGGLTIMCYMYIPIVFVSCAIFISVYLFYTYNDTNQYEYQVNSSSKKNLYTLIILILLVLFSISIARIVRNNIVIKNIGNTIQSNELLISKYGKLENIVVYQITNGESVYWTHCEFSNINYKITIYANVDRKNKVTAIDVDRKYDSSKTEDNNLQNTQQKDNFVKKTDDVEMKRVEQIIYNIMSNDLDAFKKEFTDGAIDYLNPEDFSEISETFINELGKSSEIKYVNKSGDYYNYSVIFNKNNQKGDISIELKDNKLKIFAVNVNNGVIQNNLYEKYLLIRLTDKNSFEDAILHTQDQKYTYKESNYKNKFKE